MDCAVQYVSRPPQSSASQFLCILATLYSKTKEAIHQAIFKPFSIPVEDKQAAVNIEKVCSFPFLSYTYAQEKVQCKFFLLANLDVLQINHKSLSLVSRAHKNRRLE